MILSKEFSVCLIKPRGVQKQINTIDDKTAGLWAAVTALRHELHRNPELSGEEIETKKRLMAFIRTQSHLKIVDHGERAHAGTPEDGHNPAIAIAELALFANQLQANRGGRLCTVVYMQEGHLNFGISPGDGAIGLTLRTITSVFLKLAETR
jgi:metal-dependent amidase/aminoacylase/carboxypeptidase family protein